ncbi:NAD(P)-dependent alcohol dehydrogenase [Nonomuraea sp. NPDC059023]|uniref:NAD(P)-dependent alcohol dehydrogenase n=1 Tax=unclassified Nonomuraea TaxID=2593643 RepID=UPI003679BE48
MPTAAVVWAPGQPFSLEEVELDDPRPDEVRVRMLAVGMCHTDLNAASGALPYPLPGVLGHEGVGVVEATGAAVTRTRPGDRVVLTFTSCGRCRGCRGGHPAHCDHQMELNLFGGRRADGSATLRHKRADLNGHFFGQSSFATHALVDERGIVVLPSHLTDAELPILAPLGCGAQTGAGAILNIIRPRPGDTIAIAGVGAVGLSAIMATRMTPAGAVIAIDRVQSRLDLARELGATHTSLGECPQNVDAIIDTTGNIGLLEMLIDNLGVAGQIALIGAPTAGTRASFDVNRLLLGRSIRGVTLGDSEPETFIPTLIDAHRQGSFPLEKLVRTYPFEDINRAAIDASEGVAVKPVLVF